MVLQLLMPVKRLQLTLTGFAQLPIIQPEFLMGRLKRPRQTIVFLKYKVVIRKKEKEKERGREKKKRKEEEGKNEGIYSLWSGRNDMKNKVIGNKYIYS